MTFALSKTELASLLKSEKRYMAWLAEEARLDVFMVCEKPGGPPDKRENHLGGVWVHMAGEDWLDPTRGTGRQSTDWDKPDSMFPVLRVAADSLSTLVAFATNEPGLQGAPTKPKEPSAKNGRFRKALRAFGKDRLHLPKIGDALIKTTIKRWRELRISA